MSVLIFLAVLFVLVLVHELGHFAVAKWTGMRVDEFGIGFPPKLYGVKRGETEYTFNLFPVGGFVKIFGEDGTDPANTVNSRSFVSKSKWAQGAVLIAGITMNIIFAWILVTIAFTMGVQSSVSESEATDAAVLTVTNVLPGSPAEKASIAPGSVVQSVEAEGDTLSDPTPSSFSSFVDAHPNSMVTIAYTNDNEIRVAQVTPVTGLIEAQKDKAAIGVALTLVEEVERSVFEAASAAFTFSLGGLRDITVGIGSLLYDAVFFNADLSQVAGPVGIVGLVGEASQYGITALLMFTAFISLNLAVINLLPFPALDGGRLLFVMIEAIKGSPIPFRYASMLNMVGFILLILLMVVVTWNDIARLI